MSGHALEDVTPVLAAGVGVRRGWGWALRSASFRIAAPAPGRKVVGIAVDTQAEGTTVVDLLADGLLDNLVPREVAALADAIRDLGRDTAIVATGHDAGALRLACDEVLTLSYGIIYRA